MENPHAMLQRSIKFSAFFVMIRKIIILSEQKMGPLQFFFYSLFYVDTNFLFTNLQIVLWIKIHALIKIDGC